MVQQTGTSMANSLTEIAKNVSKNIPHIRNKIKVN